MFSTISPAPRFCTYPELITRLADRFGVQCIVVGIDTWYDAATGKYHVNQYTGDESRTRVTQWETLDWVQGVDPDNNTLHAKAIGQTGDQLRVGQRRGVD